MNEGIKTTTVKAVLLKLSAEHDDALLSIADARSMEDKIRKQIAKVIESKFGVLALPPIDFLKKNFAYDTASGHVMKRQSDGQLKIIGEKHHTGYVRLNIKHKGKRYRVAAHRVAWALHYGEPPLHQFVVDHRDGDRSNNCINNLQLASHSTNMAISHNRKKPPAS